MGAAAVALAACGTAPDRPEAGSPPAPSATRGVVDPARIDRARHELPPDYEVTDVSGRVTPVAQWGFGPGWQAEPAPCAALADPALAPATLRGWSASGPGGIVYAVAAAGAAGLDATVLGGCGSWSMSAGPTTGTVRLVDAPVVDGAQTVAMAAESLTVVEGGTETRSQATTVVAVEGTHLVYVTVVTDPGSPSPALAGRFATDLLTETVAALRK